MTEENNEVLLALTRLTIRGFFSNGLQRRWVLGSYYDDVQYQVNKNMVNGNTKWEDITIYLEAE